MVRKRVEVGDAHAMYILGCCYEKGAYGLQRDYDKVLELFHRAGELGYAVAYNNIGRAYHTGEAYSYLEANYYPIVCMEKINRLLQHLCGTIIMNAALR